MAGLVGYFGKINLSIFCYAYHDISQLLPNELFLIVKLQAVSARVMNAGV